MNLVVDDPTSGADHRRRGAELMIVRAESDCRLLLFQVGNESLRDHVVCGQKSSSKGAFRINNADEPQW